jgi:hypothetical protein
MTIGGIALLAFGLLVDFPACVARVAFGADVALLAPYLRFKGMPPSVFYLLLMLVGLAVL